VLHTLGAGDTGVRRIRVTVTSRCVAIVLLTLLLGAGRAFGAVDFPTGPLRGWAFGLVTTNGLPSSLGALVDATEMRHQNADGSEDLVVDAGDHQSIHFGPGLSSLFTGTASMHGFARVKVGVVRLHVAALAAVDKLSEPLGKNPFQAAAGIAMAGNFQVTLIPPTPQGKSAGDPTTMAIRPVLECSDVLEQFIGNVLGAYIGLHTQIAASLRTTDDDVLGYTGTANFGCGASVPPMVIGVTAGTPVVVTYSAALSAVSIAGNNLPLPFGAVPEFRIYGVALNTGYVLVTDEEGHGVVGQDSHDYGVPPTEETITTTTVTTTTTTFVPPTTLPGCTAEAYCGDGMHQPLCGEACDCPTTAQGQAVLACDAATSVPTLDPSCARCVGCQIDLAPCSTTTTTTPGATTTSTDTVPAPSTTTTTLPPSCTDDAACGDDGDPCTAEHCVEGACRRADLDGVPGARCACDRPAAVACAGQTLPPRLAKKIGAACHALDRAASATKTKQRSKLLQKAARGWHAAAGALAKPAVAKALSPDCITELGTALDDAGARTGRAKP